jgi:hypothetical protein
MDITLLLLYWGVILTVTAIAAINDIIPNINITWILDMMYLPKSVTEITKLGELALMDM